MYVSRIIYWANDVADSLFSLDSLIFARVIKMLHIDSFYLLALKFFSRVCALFRYPRIISYYIFLNWINRMESHANYDCIMGFVCQSVYEFVCSPPLYFFHFRWIFQWCGLVDIIHMRILNLISYHSCVNFLVYFWVIDVLSMISVKNVFISHIE